MSDAIFYNPYKSLIFTLTLIIPNFTSYWLYKETF